MISGWDIDLTTLQEIRKHYQGSIYIDVHNYLTELDHEGQRCYRVPADIATWLQKVDMIQLNEKEYSVLNSEQLAIGDFCRKYCISEKKLINLTLGSIGSKSIIIQDGKLNSYLQKISINTNTRDTTGCGDAFSAGFIYGYLKKMDIDACLTKANCIASLYSEFSGPADIAQLRLKLKQKCQN
jgi:sugar/nucleoside kinase (ribokinase family)